MSTTSDVSTDSLTDGGKLFQGYDVFGIHRHNGVTVFRDWAPAAQAAWLIGDFNGWEGTPLEKDEFGVWSVSLPDNPDGTAAIPHNSRVKIRVQHWDGWTIDLVPAWTTYAVMPEGMESTFDAVHWDPPEGERHVWYVLCFRTQCWRLLLCILGV